MSGRPRRACLRCSTLKVRCTGLRPSCQRCQRLGRDCVYNIAAPISMALRCPVRGSGLDQNPVPPLVDVSSRSHHFTRSYLGIPPELLPNLVDVYFSHVYNASLLLHKASFWNKLNAGTLRPHVILSVCASASTFYRDTSGKHSMVESGFSREWAERAGELVSREILDPHEDNIITFINLALFWYGQGEWRRSLVCKCNAIQICYLLGIPDSRPGDTSILQVEFSRRRFWACFLVGSFCSDTISSKELPDRALSLPLPCREADLCQGAYNSSCLNGRRDGNPYGELVRVMALWNSVCLLVGQQLSDTSSRVRAIQELDSKILEWRSAMPQSLELSAATISLVPPHTLPLLLLIHIVYHQCLCSLHASIIPLFSLRLSAEGYSYARQISAQIAFEHANSVSSLIEAMLEHSLDLSRVPSFVGYSAYCSCVIQAPFISCTKAGIRERALINVLANLRVIQQLGKFWKFVYLLGFNFRAVYAAHEKHPPSPNDEPRSMEIHNFNKFACCTVRVQTSILSHNEIVLRAGGSIAEKDNKVIDMGIEDTSHGCAPITDGGIALLINELSQLNTRQGETERSSSLEPTPCLVQNAAEASQQWLDYGIFNGNCSIIPDDLEVLGEQMLVFDEWEDPFDVSADKYCY